MGGAEQAKASSSRIGGGTGAASGQEVGEASEGMTPVIIADGREGQRAGWFYRSDTIGSARDPMLNVGRPYARRRGAPAFRRSPPPPPASAHPAHPGGQSFGTSRP